ncbi:nuclear transport factor 2 family protein [Olivibacter sp. SDN3]|uniref:nuclear transport factor 2 family protein n=1 Tax=Olivibacter sp. SDN3 TaxID=2764720 RepID=UPI001650F0CE|nr:nuclear transport factor 2 family protein [Olivibacter sp. SDN3]QNL49570.1 nuclear transport factor 2 family protein [Olivibacter sp. SDN3]
MNTRDVIENIVDAFDRSDVEGILDIMAEGATWEMLGDKTFIGKDQIRDSLNGMADMEMLDSTKNHIIIEENNASVDGIVAYKGKDGKVHEMYYCDIYELSHGKVTKMISYTVNKQ